MSHSQHQKLLGRLARRRSRTATDRPTAGLGLESLEPRAMLATFSFAGFTFEQDFTPDEKQLLATGTYNGAEVDSIPGSRTGSVGFPEAPTTGFDPLLALGAILETSGGPRAINLPNGNDGTANRSGVELGWSSGRALLNATGDDLVIYESGSPNAPEAMMIQVRSSSTGTWTSWYYEAADTFAAYTGSSDGAFAFAYDLSDLGIAEGDYIDMIRIVNMMDDDRMVSATGEGFVIPEDDGDTSSFLPEPGPLAGFASFGSDRFDPDPLYVGALQTVSTPPQSVTYVNDNWEFISDEDLSGDLSVGDLVVNNLDSVNAGNIVGRYGISAFGEITNGAYQGNLTGADQIADAIANTLDGGTVQILEGTYTETDPVDTTTKALDILIGGGVVAAVDITGSITFDSDDTVFLQADSAASLDQLSVNGSITLGGASLDVTFNFTPVPETEFVFIATSAGFSGEFSGFVDGEVVQISGRSYRVSYSGGDGNDFSLTSVLLGQNTFIVGQASQGSVIRLLDTTTLVEVASVEVFPGFLGGVRVATADFDGDFVDDIVVAAAAGGGPHVKVLNGVTLDVMFEFFAYDLAFTGGVYVAAGDVTGDNIPDVITGAGAGGGPHVKIIDGDTQSEVASFFAYDPAFTGGVSVAVGDIDGDSDLDIITGAGPGGGPHVKAFDYATLTEIASFFAYDPAFAGGVSVASGDVDDDGFDDIITGAGPGGGPHVKAFDGETSTLGSASELASFFAYDAGFAGGVTVSSGDIDNNGETEILTAAGPGGGPHVRAFSVISGVSEESNFFAFDSSFTGGAVVTAGARLSPLVAAGGAIASTGSTLSLDVATSALASAIKASGMASLQGVQVQVVDLPGAQLGGAIGNTIYLDTDAAGYGWNVDGAADSDRFDLASVIDHELGHLLGFDDLPGDDDALMAGTLKPGVEKEDLAEAIAKFYS